MSADKNPAAPGGDLFDDNLETVEFHRIGVERAAPEKHLVKNAFPKGDEMAQHTHQTRMNFERGIGARDSPKVGARSCTRRRFGKQVPKSDRIENKAQRPATENSRDQYKSRMPATKLNSLICAQC